MGASTTHPYSPDSYPIQLPIMIQPDTPSSSFGQRSGVESVAELKPGQQDERGIYPIVQKVAGMFGVEGREDTGTTTLLFMLGKKAYVLLLSPFLSFPFIMLRLTL
ncbi:uncharacterized protein BDW47DRAFT_113446 [Aspergillus candidus]|uniref:Uncharacterized protein n=1 Tax=Aspergillus candidus TaxID=41067 RepID=A0A2I2EZE9_ASPCN|nr:hypothetical protein BDW47DRAFT_113446 [Aspergillus candidus]PLB33740.1 hypothetical protein BDW47DRAFT_113446 [Aspergillus candidus]